MTFKLEVCSLTVGLLIGVAAVFVLGAVSAPTEGRYQLSMTANEDYVFYGRIDTVSGKVETWKYRSHANLAVPLHEDKANGQLTPSVVK